MNEFETGMEGPEPDAFEQQLMQALRRVDAPEGFAARVIERAGEQVAERAAYTEKVLPVRPRFAMLRARVWAVKAAAAIAAMLALGVFVADRVHARHEREQVALAQQQFDIAVRVTDHALDQTRAQLQRAGLNLGD